MPGLEIDLRHRPGDRAEAQATGGNGSHEYRDVDRTSCRRYSSGRPAELSFSIRPARPEDCATIANLVRELAVYEKLEQFAKATADDFRRAPVRPPPLCRGASWPRSDGAAGRARAGFPDVLDVPRPAGALPRRHLRAARAPRPGDRQGLARERGQARPGAGFRPAGMGGARLERAGDRLLPRPGGPAAGRVDRLPDRRRPRSTGWPRWPRRDGRGNAPEQRLDRGE